MILVMYMTLCETLISQTLTQTKLRSFEIFTDNFDLYILDDHFLVPIVTLERMRVFVNHLL